MVLNYVWIAFFVIGFVAALLNWLLTGEGTAFTAMMESTFDNAKLGFELSLGLTGVMTFWLGMMKVGEAAGAIRVLARAVRPLFRRLFPGIPPDHPAMGAILMNVSANMLGLDNAATPLGLKAMREMQNLNEQTDRATNAQIMFLVLNTSGLTLIPVSIMVYKAEMNAENPADIFIPILLATFIATLCGILITALYQRVRLWDPVLLAYLGGFALFIGSLIYIFSELPSEQLEEISTVGSALILVTILMLFVGGGARKGINVYETFIEGAKEGFSVAVQIIPFLVAMLVGIGIFRASGAMDVLIAGISWGVEVLGGNTDFVPALPTALMRPFSGSGARGLMLDAMNTYGVDSFVGHVVAVIQGSTDTTFYILAVYFGSVKIRNTRHAVVCGLFADICGVVAAIGLAYLFF